MAAQTTVRPPRLRRDPAGRELRVFTGRPEMRAANQDGTIPFTGHAAVFNSRSVVLSDWWDTFREVIEPGAFESVLDADVRFLIDHDSSLILARTVAGNLRLSEDEQGLLVDADIVPTTYARDLEANMRAGNITQMSFAFAVDPDGERWELDTDGMLLRTISRVIGLYDVSCVTYPAYPETDAATRAAIQRARASRGHRATRSDESDDDAVLQDAIADLRTQADNLEALLEDEQSEPAEEQNSARSAQPRARRTAQPVAPPEVIAPAVDTRTMHQQDVRHQAFAALYGLKR